MGYASPIKKSGWSQGLYEQSATQKEELGAIRINALGECFRYSLAGAGALTAGKLCSMAAVNAHHEDVAAAAAAANATEIVMGTLSTTLAAGQLKNGMIIIQDDTGEGYKHYVTHHTSGTTPTIHFEPGLRKATAAGTTYTLMHSPWYKVVHTATEELKPVGVPLIDVTAAYYCWLQTRGVCPVLINGTVAAGMPVVHAGASSVAGAVGPFKATVASNVASPTFSVVGRAVYACNSAEYCPIDLCID